MTRSARLTLALVAAAGVLASAPAQAQEDTLVFAAIPSRTGSLSMAGADPAVTLWWSDPDAAPGLAHFRLYRDGALIATIPYGVSSAATIDALYATPAHERLARALAANLAHEAEFGAEYGGAPGASLGEAVADKLATDTFFAYFAGRLDPVIAMARGLAYVDVGVVGTVAYRLEGVIPASGSVGEQVVPLGRTTVTAGTPWIAPPATAFRVLPASALARCDAPEAMRAHGVLALDWDLPGTGGPERLALSQAIAGWDLYRSEAPATFDAPRDLRAEAELLPHDDAGEVHFAGLVKINDVPILATPDRPQDEPGYSGWAPAQPEYSVDRAEGRAQGLVPGERYAFYVVPRDLTGNYGATASVLGRVPDTLQPPSPWNVHAVRRPALNGGATPDTRFIRWPQVNVLNFTEAHAQRTWCNLEDARFTRELAYVGPGQSCPDPRSGEGARVSLRVTRYDVYRFESPADASGFQDSDGDGVADALERTPLGTTLASPGLSTPGTACDPTKKPTSAPSFKVGSVSASSATLDARGREQLEWAETLAPEDAGKVYWYRVVAVGEGGARSPMSAPVRAMFPAYRHQPRRIVDLPPGCQQYITWQVCTEGQRAAVDTTGDAVRATISCGTTVFDFPLNAPPGGAGFPPDSRVSAPWGPGSCEVSQQGALPAACNGKDITITYYDASGAVIMSTVAPKYTQDLCLCAKLQEDCNDPPPTVVTDGYMPVETDPASECVSVYRRIGGQLQRVETVCDELVDDFSSYYPDDLLGGPVCLYQVVQSADGALSSRFPLGCEEGGEAAAERPELASVLFPAGGTTAEVGIIPPKQPVLGFIAELRRADGSERVSSFVRLGERGTLGEVSAALDVGPGPAEGASEQWCLRARTVISNAAAPTITDVLSEWSPDLCVTRLGPSTVAPTYIPWPEIPTPREGNDLVATYLDGDGFPIVHLGSVEPSCAHEALFPACNGDDAIKGTDVPACLRPIAVLELQECALRCADVKLALVGKLGFVAYRQGRPVLAAGTTADSTDYAQISPLIDYVHCTALDTGLVGGTGDTLDTLADPYVGIAAFSGVFDGKVGKPWNGTELFFVDRAPHIGGWEYRYQFVYFDSQGEITETRTSNWTVAD